MNILQLAFGWAALGLAVTAHGQVNEQVLYSFTGANSGGKSPCKLVQGADGCFYGATTEGGSQGVGTLFKVSADGASCTFLHSFTTNNVADGASPSGDMVLSADGWLCGTTSFGGANGAGAAYRIRTNGTGFMLLHSFTLHTRAAYGNTEWPHGLTQGRDGALYGVIEGSTGGSPGVVYKLSSGGGGYAEIHVFEISVFPDLGMPVGGLVQGRDGALYGTTFAGSLHGKDYTGGGVFKLNPDGTGYSILYAFGYKSAQVPYPSSYATTLIQGQDGYLYGTTKWGGTNALGTIFKLSTDGADYTQLHSFATTGVDHNSVYASALVQGNDGALYGTTLAGGLGNTFRIKTNGADFQVLWNFAAESGYDAQVPDSGLILGRDGALYGVSQFGGQIGCGTVFKLVPPTGAITVLDALGAHATDGASPGYALAQGTDGTLYGTTSTGGHGGTSSGSGTLFKVNPAGLDYASLYRFSADGSTGRRPSGVVFGHDGGLYGGASGGANGAGVLYRINANGTGYSLLHTFTTNSNDGRYPGFAPIQGHDGALYGVTAFGGNIVPNRMPPGMGTVYTIRTNGSNYEVLYRFSTNSAAGAYPSSALAQGADGMLYGTGYAGSNYWGFVYQLGTNGAGYRVLYNFLTNGVDGLDPGSVLVGSDGRLYGATMSGGRHDAGTVFTLRPNGRGYAQLYAFSTNGADGQTPVGLRQARDGTLYGATRNGGESGLGTVFKLNPNGTGYAVAHSFVSSEGGHPLDAPIEGPDGAWYGTLSSGGAHYYGTVYRLAVRTGEFTSARVLANKQFQFYLNGGALNYRVDASTDLLAWVTLTNVHNAIGAIPITDRHAAGFPRRFYRAVWTPY